VEFVSNCSLKENGKKFPEGEIKSMHATTPSQEEAPLKYIFHIPSSSSLF
jgi:hypothetical protein